MNKSSKKPSTKPSLLPPKSIHSLFETLAQEDPSPTTELVYHSPFELLVAVLLSAQATDASVNKATKQLFAIANTPEQFLALGTEGLIPFVKSIGLYQTKTKHLLKTCALLIEHHQGQVPTSREALEALPGVGRKTANVLLNTLFGEPTVAVDTHVFRVANRTGLTQAKTPLATELSLLKRIPVQYLPHAHHWLILHGRYVCTARKPSCPTCPIRKICLWPNKTLS